ncbi:hypothetical protein PY546_25230 [Providencia stuartii]|nr:hypothetical protein [Providencia stuartii]
MITEQSSANYSSRKKERYENIKENGQLAGFIDEAIAAGDGQWIVEHIKANSKEAA